MASLDDELQENYKEIRSNVAHFKQMNRKLADQAIRQAIQEQGRKTFIQSAMVQSASEIKLAHLKDIELCDFIHNWTPQNIKSRTNHSRTECDVIWTPK